MHNFFVKIMFVIAILSTLNSCEDNTTLSCIDTKINEIKQTEVTNPPTEVWKWDVDRNTYYYFTSDCCDQFNFLYNEKCEIVCAPDGGITGNGDGSCPEFIGEIEKTLFWKDPRTS